MSTEFALPAADVPVIDETRLLSEFGGDQEILAELRDLFMEHVPPLFQEIETAIDKGDAQEIAKNTHSLKGACSTYGAPRLAMACKAAELAAKSGDVQAVKDHLDDLRAEYEKVCAAISGMGTQAP